MRDRPNPKWPPRRVYIAGQVSSKAATSPTMTRICRSRLPESHQRLTALCDEISSARQAETATAL
jgi:hypothetical protein